jgi:hypothetical protein
MNIFDKATAARKPKTKDSQKVAYMYATILVIFALTQLFTFDKFLVLIDSFWLPGGGPIAYMLGGIIVSSEVLALPFLLSLKLSLSMRVFSMILGWLVPLMWLTLSLWLLFTINAVSNIGFFGTTVKMMPGWWAIFICIALEMLAIWASWGLWPISKKKKA